MRDNFNQNDTESWLRMYKDSGLKSDILQNAAESLGQLDIWTEEESCLLMLLHFIEQSNELVAWAGAIIKKHF